MDSYITKGNYSSHTLMGNWAAERAHEYNKTHKPAECKHSTPTYNQHQLGVKSLTASNPELVFNGQFDAEEDHVTPSMRPISTRNYFDNYSTLYDLSYNHFPKWFFNKEFMLKNPKLEYIENYGNSLSSGLTDFMNDKWAKEKVTLRRINGY